MGQAGSRSRGGIYRGVGGGAPSTAVRPERDDAHIMSEIVADLEELEAEDTGKDGVAVESEGEGEGERLERLLRQDRRRQCVIRAGLLLCAVAFVVSVYKLLLGVTCPGPSWVNVSLPISPEGAALPLLKLPLRVHALRSSTSAALNASSVAADVRRYVGGLNAVYARAGVTFELLSHVPVQLGPSNARMFQAAVDGAQRLQPGAERDKAVAQALHGLLHHIQQRQQAALGSGPVASLSRGWTVFVAHDLPFCGMAPLDGATDRGVAFVRESGCARIAVRDGWTDPVALIMAHEIGHTLSLGHTRDDCGVMSSGAAGATLTAAQVERARRVAATGRGWLRGAGEAVGEGWRWRRRRLVVVAAQPGGDGSGTGGDDEAVHRWWCSVARWAYGGAELPALACYDAM